MQSESQKKATERYQKKSRKQITLAFYPPDYDVYEFLKEKENSSGFIKDLVREEMKRPRA